MRITNVETFIVGNPWKNWVFARLDTDEGIYGIGEATLNAFAKTVEAAIHELKPMYVGMDPFQIETIVQRMTRDVYSDGAQIHMSAVAAIEVACWDIVGKYLNQPVYNLLGGRCHEKVRAYANGWYRGDRTVENFQQLARQVVERGYTALKFDPFGAAWRVMDRADLQLSIDIVGGVREAVGPNIDILVEGHNRFSASTALQIAEKIAPYNPTWFEEPVHFQAIEAIVEVAKHSPVPIACGESYTNTRQFAELLAHNAISILQPDPLAVGGILTCRQVAAIADAHYGVIAPHNAQGPVSTAICVQVAACTPNFFLQEVFDEFNVTWEERLTIPPTKVINGYIEIPERPGLGIDLNWDELKQHPYAPNHYLPLFKPGWERREGQGDNVS